MGGGGGNTTTQTSGVPEWLRPDVQRAFGAATDAHQSGQLSTQAALTPEQLRAKEVQTGLAEDAIAGRGAFDYESQLKRDLQHAQGQQLASQVGNLGSTRGERARNAALADVSLKHQLNRQQQQSQGAQALGALGQQSQQRAQERADLGHTGLQRLFGYYGSGAAGNQTTQSGGGGK